MAIAGTDGHEISLGIKSTTIKECIWTTDNVMVGALEDDFDYHWAEADHVTCSIRYGEPSYVLLRVVGDRGA